MTGNSNASPAVYTTAAGLGTKVPSWPQHTISPACRGQNTDRSVRDLAAVENNRTKRYT